MSKTMKIAERYATLCREHRNEEILKTMFAEDAISVEAAAMPGLPQEARGLAAIRAKGEWWVSNHEVHSASVAGPWPHGDRFIVGFAYDVTNKPSGKRMQMQEMGLFTVKNGRIVSEEFFYDAD